MWRLFTIDQIGVVSSDILEHRWGVRFLVVFIELRRMHAATLRSAGLNNPGFSGVHTLTGGSDV